MKSSILIWGVLVGSFVGAVGALLFAPHKGSITRKIITRKGEEYADLLEEKVDDLLMTIDTEIGNVKKEVTGFIKRENMKAHELSQNGHAR